MEQRKTLNAVKLGRGPTEESQQNDVFYHALQKERLVLVTAF